MLMSDFDNAAHAATQEPSMEDILSSIRRILSEDGEVAAPDAVEHATPALHAPAPAGESRPEGFDRADAPSRRQASRAGRANAAAEVDLAEREDGERAPGRSNVFHLTPDMRLPPERQVLSPVASTASTDVLSQLAKAILDRRDIGIGGRDVTIEGLVREMLRPLLKEWLDRNLPYLIERLVKKEIDLMVNRAERLED
jgi:cell pole-organizing protein PopZ